MARYACKYSHTQQSILPYHVIEDVKYISKAGVIIFDADCEKTAVLF